MKGEQFIAEVRNLAELAILTGVHSDKIGSMPNEEYHALAR
jgi:hypothetical protein